LENVPPIFDRAPLKITVPLLISSFIVVLPFIATVLLVSELSRQKFSAIFRLVRKLSGGFGLWEFVFCVEIGRASCRERV